MENSDIDSNWLKKLWGGPSPDSNEGEGARLRAERDSGGTGSSLFSHLPDKRVIAVFLSTLLLFALPAMFFYTKYQNEIARAKELTKSLSENEVKTLVEKVGGFVEMPQDELPTIATVSDAEKLSSQSFFSQAQDGDKVIIYERARRAILYRPSTNKVIEVASLAIPAAPDTPDTAGAATTATSSPQVTTTPTPSF